jgi:uncharacterized protein (DUF342 family)
MAETKQQGVEVGIQLISEIKDDAYTLRLESHNNQLECRASIKVRNLNSSISPDELVTLLKKFDISDAIDLERLALFCTKAAQGEDPQNYLIAKGLDPVTGENGWFELLANTGKEKTTFEEDDHGRVDFKAVQTFTNIEAGQVIGTIHPPGEGAPGKSISGKPVPAKPGNPVSLIAGDGVILSKDGSQALANKPGRVVFENRYLTIAEEFVVAGDVDLKVGNIVFNGVVDIKGDVLDDFHITASKGINITGSVGACQLESEGPVSIGSMAGMGLGRIRCRGTLRAKTLNHVTVECWGDVMITNEIRHSVVKATGKISVEQGLIAGGQSIALEGIEAKIFGTHAGTKTHLTSGVYFPETDRLQYLQTRTRSVAYQLERIAETLKALGQKPLEKMRSALRDATELRIGILNQRQGSMEEERQTLAAELATYQTEAHPTANPKINASSAVREGVIISLGETTEEIKLERSGPVSIIENSREKSLRFLPRSPLKISAEKMEEETLQMEAPAGAHP